MSVAVAPTVRSTLVEHYLARIDAHLSLLAQGHDPLGHLFAIERLARGARADWWAAQRDEDRPRPTPT